MLTISKNEEGLGNFSTDEINKELKRITSIPINVIIKGWHGMEKYKDNLVIEISYKLKDNIRISRSTIAPSMLEEKEVPRLGELIRLDVTEDIKENKGGKLK